MIQHFNNIRRRFLALDTERKLTFLAVLSVMIIVFAGGTVMFFKKSHSMSDRLRELKTEQKLWFSQKKNIEQKLATFNFDSLKKSDEFEVSKIEESVEEILTNSEKQFTLNKGESSTFGDFRVHQLNISIPHAQLVDLVDLAEGIASLGNQVALSKIDISTKVDGSLGTNLTVSILEM